ncbi:MAG: sialate O-acetylesterase [Verrucomicrobiales bacterium]
MTAKSFLVAHRRSSPRHPRHHQWRGLDHFAPQPVGHAHQPKDPKTRQYGNFGQPLGGFGPGNRFRRTVMNRQPERRLAVVKTAFSGTGIARDWDPDAKDEAGACYRTLVGECQRAIAAAKARGILLRPTAFLWVQGESDANATDAPLYAARLKHLIASLRRDLAAPTLPALLAVNTQFGLGKNTHMPAIVEAQQQVGAADP